MSSHNSGRCCGHRLVLFWSGWGWIGQRFSPLVKQRRQKPTVAVSCLCVTDYCVTAIHWHTFEAVYNRNVFCAERSIYFKCHLYNTCRRCPYSILRVKKCKVNFLKRIFLSAIFNKDFSIRTVGRTLSESNDGD